MYTLKIKAMGAKVYQAKIYTIYITHTHTFQQHTQKFSIL